MKVLLLNTCIKCAYNQGRLGLAVANREKWEFISEGKYSKVFLLQKRRLHIFPTDLAIESKKGVLKYLNIKGHNKTINSLLEDTGIETFFYRNDDEMVSVLNRISGNNNLFIYAPTSLNNPVEEFFCKTLSFNKVWRVKKGQPHNPIWYLTRY